MEIAMKIRAVAQGVREHAAFTMESHLRAITRFPSRIDQRAHIFLEFERTSDRRSERSTGVSELAVLIRNRDSS